MRTRLALLTIGSVAVLTTPALAQDNTAFTGPRVEALVGYDISRPGSTVDNDNIEDSTRENVDGVNYGIGIGYDIALGGLVAGIEGQFIESSAKTDYDTTNFNGFGVGNVEAGRDLYIGARLGALVTPSTLAYVKGGYTNARYNLLATDNETDVDADVDVDGWRVGGGVEQAINENFFVKGEYAYSNYGSGEVRLPGGAESDSFDVDVDRHQIMLGVGYRF